MRDYSFILLLVINISVLQAQPVISDSLRHVLRNSPDDSNKVKRLKIAVRHLPYVQSDSALYYSDSIIRLSEKIGYPYGIAHGNSVKGESYVYSGDYSKAIFYIYPALRIYEASGDWFEASETYSQLAEVYMELGDYKKALEYWFIERGILI